MRYLVAAAVLSLAACGSKSETEVASGTYTDPETGETSEFRVTADADDGESGNISIKTKDGEMRFGSGAANAALPAGFTPYPGSKMTGGFTADGQGGMASFEAKAKAADVIAHFRKQAEAQGMDITSEVRAGETLMIGAEKKGAGKSGIQITATQAGDTVSGSVTYGAGS